MEKKLYTSFLFSTLLLLPSLYVSVPVQPNTCVIDDQNALLEIKQHLNNSTLFTSWIPGTDCCKWVSVKCKTLPKTTTRRVNYLNINFGMDIFGTIPSAIGDLPYLESLIIRFNFNLTGSIPSSITKLTNLRSLLLSFNNLSGPIPSFLDQLTNLEYMEFDENHFTGPIPNIFGHLTKLITVDFTKNRLTGTIPASLGLVLGLQSLRLSNNSLSGPIPKSLGNLDCTIMDLTGNQITGDASFLFGENKTNLNRLQLGSNQLSFDLGKVLLPIGPFNQSILWLDLSHNMIYGQVPVWLGKMPELSTLDLSYNQLCGPIPTVGEHLQEFPASAFEHNKCLCGAPLPPCKS